MQRQDKPDYLTTRELADLLRLKERKIYDLAASGEIPCTRATGKLLFPRRAIEAWLARHSAGPATVPAAARPDVMLGSHDPLLDWAVRQSRCGLASIFDSSLDGLERFAARQGVASGLHLYDAQSRDWNVAAVAARFAAAPVVLVEWAWRERGLVVQPGLRVHALADLAGRRVVPRQAEAGSQKLFLHVLGEAGLAPDALAWCAPARSEADAALAVQDGKADAAFGLRTLARQHRLGFVPLLRERFDLLVDRRAWFEPALQALVGHCRTPAFAAKAAELEGYDVSGFGQVHYIGA